MAIYLNINGTQVQPNAFFIGPALSAKEVYLGNVLVWPETQAGNITPSTNALLREGPVFCTWIDVFTTGGQDQPNIAQDIRFRRDGNSVIVETSMDSDTSAGRNGRLTGRYYYEDNSPGTFTDDTFIPVVSSTVEGGYTAVRFDWVLTKTLDGEPDVIAIVTTGDLDATYPATNNVFRSLADGESVGFEYRTQCFKADRASETDTTLFVTMYASTDSLTANLGNFVFTQTMRIGSGL